MLSEKPMAGPSSAVLFSSPHLTVGACGPVHLTWYRGPLTLALLSAADELHQRLIRAHKRTAVLGYLEPGIPVPPSEIRERSAQLIKQNGAHVAAAGLVMPGDGFWVSAARSVVTASFVVARNPYPSKCFGEIDDAAAYVLEALGERRHTVAEVTRAMLALRAPP